MHVKIRVKDMSSWADAVSQERIAMQISQAMSLKANTLNSVLAFVCMCMCVLVYVCMYVYMYVCIMCVCVCFKEAFTSVLTCVCVFVCVCLKEEPKLLT